MPYWLANKGFFCMWGIFFSFIPLHSVLRPKYSTFGSDLHNFCVLSCNLCGEVFAKVGKTEGYTEHEHKVMLRKLSYWSKAS